MNTPLNEAAIRGMIEAVRKTNPHITSEDVIKRIRTSRESQGLVWSEDLERKIRYCIQINPD
jgi:SpoVK/Ycf46/Vps4 family AAA+-type ATPase